MEFRIKNIQKQVKKDFEKSWLTTAKLVSKKGRKMQFKKTKGKKHPVIETINKFRKIFLSFGFEEMILPTIIPQNEVYRQYGPEAPLILDRVFYLAGLNREELGISKEKKIIIRNLISGFSKFKKLSNLLREYKRGLIEADDLIEKMVEKLKINENQATQIIDKAFPEFKKIKPISTELTLRSHMTASWFPALSKLQRKRTLPLKLFSIGNRYRKEQRQDDSHLFVSTSASLVIMSKEIALEDGIDLTKKILKEFGFNKVKVITKKTTSKYYAPGMDLEIYIKDKSRDLEIANLGFYSPVSLANYKIWYPVLNMGFGVERIAMILQRYKDVRKLVYGEVA